MNTMALPAPTRSTCAVLRKGWGKFLAHVETDPVLLTSRLRAAKHGGNVRAPLLAVAVPTHWVYSAIDRDESLATEVKELASHQARQSMAPLCKDLSAAEGDGYVKRFEVRSYRNSGTLRTGSSAAASHDLFSLVQVGWFARATNTTTRELAHVDALLPWIDPEMHR